ncbi:MAG: SDR family NAD(P)-dependent oxidoreductase [Acidimicrobiales bacterium]|jgi:NAD(P)-dependent dehydrogenase (short-subunit alcohol dehydrogenase family)
MSVAIVTGASRGLGQALATGLAGAGWSLVVDGRDVTALCSAADVLRAQATPGARIVAVAGDVTDADHRHDLVAEAFELGGLDLVVNNAGTLGASPLPSLADYPLGDLRVAFEVNVVAPLGLMQDALPLLLDAPHPRVLNVTSDAAVEAYEGWGGYGAGKAALEHLGAVLAVEFPALTVWTVDPGDLRTAMHQAAFPGEDISDRPEPATVVPAFMELITGDRPSGRYRAAELASAGAVT